MKKSLATVTFALAILAGSLPAGADVRVYVRVGPPAPIVETRVIAPSPRHVWIAGYHRWDGGAYVWVPGRWDLPPAGYRVWEGGHWAHHHSNGYYWVEGRWR
jgi:WXXGXW repeat (2 copies)